MPNPSAEEARAAVRSYVASFAQMDVNSIAGTMVLGEAPLRFDDNKLVFLATTLRGYVKSFGSDGTVKAADTRKAGLTVEALGDLVFSRLRA